MRLRLYHHSDGARIAYREQGTGPALALLHSALLSHREFMPVVEHLADRFRVVLPDLPLHGDSEDRPRHPYTLDWLAEVIAACSNTSAPSPWPPTSGAGPHTSRAKADMTSANQSSVYGWRGRSSESPCRGRSGSTTR